MVDKTKFIGKLKTKYKNLGFSDKAFDGVADYLSQTVADDATDEVIETAIGGVENLLKAFQGDIDSRVNAAVERARKEASKPTKQDNGGDPDPKKDEPDNKPDDVPEWAKTLITAVSELKNGKTTETRKQALEAKLKDAPDSYKNKILKDFNRMKFDTDEEFNTYLTETEEDLKVAVQELADQGLKAQGKPLTGGAPANDSKQATKEELDAVISQIM